MNDATGAHAFVFLLTMNAVPMPQLGWHPHFNDPQSALDPCIRSVTSENALDADSGNQSRSGSVTPVCCLQVPRQVRERVAPGVPVLVGDVLVPPGERHRLERHEADLVAVLQRELDDRPDLVVVDGVDDGDDEADVDVRRGAGSRSREA